MIPPGRVATYGQVAREAGLPGRARLVGLVLSQLPEGTGLPWHRVVGASGVISPRPSGGHKDQANRLMREGVLPIGGRVPMAQYTWQPLEP